MPHAREHANDPALDVKPTSGHRLLGIEGVLVKAGRDHDHALHRGRCQSQVQGERAACAVSCHKDIIGDGPVDRQPRQRFFHRIHQPPPVWFALVLCGSG